MATPDQIRRFVNATRPRDWYGQCAGLTYRTIADNGGYAPDIYPSAFAAYLAASIESTRPELAPPGAIHYWDYTGIDNRGLRARWGHVAVDIHGGGRHVLSATGHAHEWWGNRAGLISVAAQSARGMPYLGWSRLYGRRNRLTIGTPAPAGGASHTPAPVIPKEDTVTHAISLNGKHFFAVGEEFISHHATFPQADVTRAVNSATDELHRLNTTQFVDLLDGMGIPRGVVNIDTGAVLNPQSGKHEGNGVWSRRREAVAKLDELLQRPVAQAPAAASPPKA